jgi:serine/threonine protein phosphatase PrpC
MYVQSHSLQGKRASNEDKHFHLLNLDNKDKNYNKVNFVSVFDGHGGKMISKYLKKNLPKFFINKFKKKKIYQNKRLASNYFNGVFNTVQDNLTKKHPRGSRYCGSTALVGIQYLDKNNKSKLWIANVGDSRAVLCKNNNGVLQLSEDHKPNSESERNRIGELGGKIYYDGYDWRIGSLSLSRAMGDNDEKPFVSHSPQIYRYNLNKNDKFIIFACDGLWDVISNKRAVDFVLRKLKKDHKGKIAKKLCEFAIKEGSTDNVSVVILFLN